MKYRLMFGGVLLTVLLALAGWSSLGSTAFASRISQSAALTQMVHVTISDDRISADHSTFYTGRSYRFVVTNTGQVTYQFVMGQRGWDYGHMMGRGGWDYNHMPMGWQHQMMAYRSYQIAPGATTTFDYTFPASEVSSRFGFGCYQQGGMWYPSTVQPQP